MSRAMRRACRVVSSAHGVATSPWVLVAALTSLALAACGDDEPVGVVDDEPVAPACDLDRNLLVADLPPGAIPALDEPAMVGTADPGAAYLDDADRVLGVVVDGQARAYPHPVLDHHEIVTDRVGETVFTVTFCPLTGSGVALDPFLDGERLRLGVSGMLFANNLVYYDRTTGDVFGPQLSFQGTCTPFQDRTLSLRPLVETSWGQWRRVHPDTKVISRETGFVRNYEDSPYENYKRNDDLAVDMPVDHSRPLKERVLGIRDGSRGGRGFPFGALEAEMGSRGAMNLEVKGAATALFFDAAAGGTAIAFHAEVGGQTLTFDAAHADGLWIDRESESVWNLAGLAVSGPMKGTRLRVRDDAFVVYWFAWRHFQPDAVNFTG